MNIKEIVKIIAILGCILFISITLSLVVTNHTEHCYIENCPTCALIKTAINFIEYLSNTIKYFILLDVAIYLYYILVFDVFKRKQIPLVKLKVRLNE